MTNGPDWVDVELRGHESPRHRFFAEFLEARGVEDPCGRCDGLGVRGYASTSTWRGGIGGQAITSDVCDECWGSGDSYRKWPSWRAQRCGSSDTFALVTTAGDPSVGIPGAAVTIEGLPPGMDDTERRDTRDLLADAFSDLFGEPSRVEFGDEIAALNEAEKEVR